MPLDRKQVVLTAFQRLDRTGRGEPFEIRTFS